MHLNTALKKRVLAFFVQLHAITAVHTGVKLCEDIAYYRYPVETQQNIIKNGQV